jgi:hypothetical protein
MGRGLVRCQLLQEFGITKSNGTYFWAIPRFARRVVDNYSGYVRAAFAATTDLSIAATMWVFGAPSNFPISWISDFWILNGVGL